MTAVPETTMGGSGEGFPETVWSTVLRSPDQSPVRRASLEQLCMLYWRPVYRYIRLSQKATVEDAKDLTQEFFCYVLEEEVIPKYEKSKGRFRHFLKGVLRNFMSTYRRDQNRVKRGGATWILPLDQAGLESSDEGSPEDAFDRQWTSDVLNESVAELKRALPPDTWRAYEAYYQSADPGSPSYESVAHALGLTVHQVKHLLDEARARLEAIVRKRVSNSVISSDELADEMNDLFSD